MIKLKNLWKVALATMAMSAMLVACDSTSNTEDEVTPGTYTPGTGVYELKAPKDKIGSTFNSWGGFSVLLLKEDQLTKLEKTKDGKEQFYPQAVGTFDNPTAQLKLGGDNLKFPKYGTAKGSAEVKSGEKVVNSAWATLDEKNFTFYVDMSKILCDDSGVEVMVFADKNEITGDKWLKSGRNLDLTGYKPYVIALFDGEEDIAGKEGTTDVTVTYAEYAAYCQWGTGIWEMKTSTATKPTSFAKFLDEADVSAIDATTAAQAGAKIVFPSSNVTGVENITVTFKDGKGSAEFTIGENPVFADWKQGGDFFAAYFQFWAGDDKEYATTNKQYYVADKAVTTLGKAVKLTDDGETGGNLIVKDLNAAGTYVVTINALADIPTITVTKEK